MTPHAALRVTLRIGVLSLAMLLAIFEASSVDTAIWPRVDPLSVFLIFFEVLLLLYLLLELLRADFELPNLPPDTQQPRFSKRNA